MLLLHYVDHIYAGAWEARDVYPINGSKRGRLAVSKNGDLFIILPDSQSPTMRILKATKAGGYKEYEEGWSGSGLSGEPLVDTYRLEEDGVLSLFARKDVDGDGSKKEVVILDFAL